MATIIKTTGEEIEIPKPNARRINEIVGGWFDIARTHDGRAMFVHDEGLLLGLPVNEKATALYRNGHVSPLVGDAVLLTAEETREDEQA